MTNNGKRIEKFITECEQHGIKFAPKDRGRIMSGFERRLVEEFGEGFAKASFEEIMSTLDGCGIRAIEEYIQQMDADISLSFDLESEPENSQDKSIEASSIEGSAEADKSSPEEPSEEIQPSATAKDAMEKTGTPKEKTTSNKPKTPKKEMQGSDLVNILLGNHKSIDTATNIKIKELKRRIYLLQRSKEVFNRGLTIYRKDFRFLSALDKITKERETFINGIKLDGMKSILHVACTLIVKELSSDNEAIIKELLAASAVRDDEELSIDNEIAKLEKELEALKK